MADLTYIRLETEFVYLAAILDAFSRRVISWALEGHHETAGCSASRFGNITPRKQKSNGDRPSTDLMHTS